MIFPNYFLRGKLEKTKTLVYDGFLRLLLFVFREFQNQLPCLVELEIQAIKTFRLSCHDALRLLTALRQIFLNLIMNVGELNRIEKGVSRVEYMARYILHGQSLLSGFDKYFYNFSLKTHIYYKKRARSH